MTVSLIALLCAVAAASAAPALAGTYEVLSCGPGGVNNAWTASRIGRVDFGDPVGNDLLSYETSLTCADGVLLRAGSKTNVASWGTDQWLQLTAPAGNQIIRLALWRQGHAETTPTGGYWSLSARTADLSPLGGPFGPDQCVPSTVACNTGAPGTAASALVTYDVATSAVSLGLSCGTPSGIKGCDTGTPNALGFLRIASSIATIRDDLAPTVNGTGALFGDGWQRGDASLDWTATDSAGVRAARLVVDGQEVSRTDLVCDYTFLAPCRASSSGRLGLGSAPVADGRRTVQLVVEDAAGNPTIVTRAVSIDVHAPTAVLSRASGKTITVSVADGASGVAGGTISVRNSPSEPFRALPTTLAGGRLTAKLDRGSAASVGISVTVSDNAGNVTAGALGEMSLRVGGRALSGGGASVSYGRSAGFSGRLVTRDGVALAGQAVAVEETSRVAGSSPTVVGTVTTDARGRFLYRAPAGPSRRLRFVFAGGSGLAPLSRSAQMRVRASSTINASPRTLRGGGRVRFSGRLGLRGATVPRSGKLVDLQAYDGGRWRTFATARARGSKGAWSSTYRFAGNPGRYPIRLRIRREDVFPYDLGYSRSVIVRVR